MNLKELISWLENRPRFKDKTDLSKMINLSKRLGDPHKFYKTIHITGTNGKGSTAHFLSSILKSKYKVGLFTSPYILKFNERIQINDEMIDDETLYKLIYDMKEFITKYEEEIDDKFTYFELLTMISFIYFKNENVDYAIIEVGIGGLLDSTNIITPELSIITSLGIDHEKQLGNTIESILINKLGIVKENGKLITSLTNYQSFIDEDLKLKNAHVIYYDKEAQLLSEFPLMFKFKEMTFKPRMQGSYQINNASLAIISALEIDNSLSSEEIIKGVNESYNPGRFELIKNKPYVILDGAHNDDAISALKTSLLKIFEKDKIKILFACMEDKSFNEMLTSLKEISNDITITEIDYHRALKSELLKEEFVVIKDPLKAYELLYNDLKEEEVLVITGSLYFVSYFKNNLK